MPISDGDEDLVNVTTIYALTFWVIQNYDGSRRASGWDGVVLRGVGISFPSPSRAIALRRQSPSPQEESMQVKTDIKAGQSSTSILD